MMTKSSQAELVAFGETAKPIQIIMKDRRLLEIKRARKKIQRVSRVFQVFLLVFWRRGGELGIALGDFLNQFAHPSFDDFSGCF